jgi:hypothetical protein
VPVLKHSVPSSFGSWASSLVAALHPTVLKAETDGAAVAAVKTLIPVPPA